MKRLAAMLLFFTLICVQGCAERYFEISQPRIQVGLRDMNINVVFNGWGKEITGSLSVVDEQGTVLGVCQVYAGMTMGSVPIVIPGDAPAVQTIRLIYHRDGREWEQDSTLLITDQAYRDGIQKVDTNQKKMAITFDSANGEGRIGALLQVLSRHQVHCTFFLQGDFVENYPEWVEEIDRNGHELANHSMHHPLMPETNNDEIYEDLLACNDALESISHKPVRLYRPPGGYYTYRDRAVARALGCEMILWSFDSRDGFLGESTEDGVWNSLMAHTEPGSIALMHIYGYYTPEILDRYLPMMQRQGYEFVTVSELLQLSADTE